ncbi:hypothetical protein F5B18DRAFT_47194 [Nemania serpens]|nr:hypothetical protein F5B18DRAFT_47194 [Nemania serpens]
MSRLDTLEHFVAKVDIAMGKINDFMARVDLAMETMKGDLQSFSAGMVGLLRGWGFFPRTPRHHHGRCGGRQCCCDDTASRGVTWPPMPDAALGKENHMMESICKQAWQGCRGIV